MLINWLLKNTCENREVKNPAEELSENRTPDVPTKIFASSSRGNRPPTKYSHPNFNRRKIHRSNQPYKRKYSEELIKLGFKCILVNDEPRRRSLKRTWEQFASGTEIH